MRTSTTSKLELDTSKQSLSHARRSEQNPISQSKDNALQAMLNVVLPVQFDERTLGTYAPKLMEAHITGKFNEVRSTRLHHGIDFNYPVGQSGINLQHPTFYSPVAGKVVGKSPHASLWHTITIEDERGYLHQFLHADSMKVKLGERIEFGQALGTMGNYSAKNAANVANGTGHQHIHYQIRDAKGAFQDPGDWWHKMQRGLLPSKQFTQSNQSNQKTIENAQTQTQTQTQNHKPSIQFNALNDDEYAAKRLAFIKNREGSKNTAYFDGASIAIGYGFDLLKHSNHEINKTFKAAHFPSLTETQKQLLSEARTKNCSAERRNEIAQALHLQLGKGGAAQLFDASIQAYEKRLNHLLAPHEIPKSTERLALLSMTYHGRLQNYARGPHILSTIKNGLDEGDRAQIWHSIRTDIAPCKSKHLNGFIRRAQHEADLFNPYEKTLEQTRPSVLANIFRTVKANFNAHETLEKIADAASSGMRYVNQASSSAAKSIKSTATAINQEIGTALENSNKAIHNSVHEALAPAHAALKNKTSEIATMYEDIKAYVARAMLEKALAAALPESSVISKNAHASTKLMQTFTDLHKGHVAADVNVNVNECEQNVARRAR